LAKTLDKSIDVSVNHYVKVYYVVLFSHDYHNTGNTLLRHVPELKDTSFAIIAGKARSTSTSRRMNSINTTIPDWQTVFQVNFFAPIMLARGLIEELKKARGAVVNVTSIAGSRVHPFAGSAYATSKAALAALTREMAHDFGPHGIRVNAISPGEIETSILSPGTEKLIEQIPLRRLGQPEEVAKAIYFLCTDASSYVTGAELHINGGQHV